MISSPFPSFVYLFLCVGLLVGCDSGGANSASGDGSSPSGPSTPSSVVGTWEGILAEGRTYEARVVMTISALSAGAPAGTVRYEYSSIECEETIVYEGPDGADHAFQQTTETGACSVTGRIRVRLQNDGQLSWRFEDAGGEAETTLAPSDGGTSGDGGAGGSTGCQSRTGSSMAASVGGTDLCTDLGTAQLSTALDERLSVVGFFGTAGTSITLTVDEPAVGTFDLTQADAEHEAFYASSSGASFAADRDEGSGTITITTLSDTRAVGTFSFRGVSPSGTQVQVSGAFDFALTTMSF